MNTHARLLAASLSFLALFIVGSCSNKHVVSIAITPQNASVAAVGQTTQFIAMGAMSDSRTPPENLTSMATWSSSTPSVATVGSGGLATATGCGTTTITAQASGLDGSTQLTVSCSGSTGPPVLQSISLYPSSPTVPQLQQTVQFIALAVYVPATSNSILTGVATWASSNAAVASVNASGLATALACGSTTITAEYQGVVGQMPLTVQCTGNQTLQSISVLPGSPTVPQIGQGTQFLALGTLVGGGQEDLTSTATWSSSNTQVAAINISGTATTVNCGTSTISAKYQPAGGTPIVGATLLTVTCNSIASIELLVEKSGSVNGIVTSMPTGIDCGLVCGGLFNEGTGFVLTAPGATWGTGCDQQIGGACYFTLVPDTPGGTQKVVTVSF